MCREGPESAHPDEREAFHQGCYPTVRHAGRAFRRIPAVLRHVERFAGQGSRADLRAATPLPPDGQVTLLG
jgi:hypothetical protein